MTFANPLFAPTGRAIRPPSSEGDEPPEDRHAYDFRDERIVTAVNVAIAARRPLLVTGPPGAGKSSLAQAVATEKDWTYAERVITSRTEIGDLTATFDAVRRLADAQVPALLPNWAYVEPGVLWWAFDAETAVTRGDPKRLDVLTDRQREQLPPLADVRRPGASPETVVLLDEIDKAEPDLPNDLLEPLDRLAFDALHAGTVEARNDVFVVITSNGERRLPPAFLRRCVQLELRPSDEAFFASVARAHFGPRDDALYEAVAADFVRYADAARSRNRREPSTAEYLDTLRACMRFDERPGSAQWLAIVETALWKEPELPEELVGGDGAGGAS
jgi:MoxR-like ATPase